jgi:uncharacterized protein (TIGR02246 family)
MKLRSVCMTMLIVCIGTTAFSQQLTGPQQYLRQQIEAAIDRFVQAFNQQEAPTAAALYTADGIAINSRLGMLTGREAIEQSLRGDFKNRPDARLMVTVDQVQALGRDAALAAGPFTVTIPGSEFHGSFALVFEREGEAWKLRLSNFTRQINPTGVVGSAAPVIETQSKK